MSNEVRFHLRLIAAERYYECSALSSMSFDEIMSELEKIVSADLDHDFLFTGDEIICEHLHGTICDRHVPVSSLGIKDGMTFDVY